MADPVDGVVYRAGAFLALGQIDRAEDLLRAELGQRPDDGRLLLALARVFEERRAWPRVIDTATAALAANPASLNARMMIAWAAYQLGDRDLMKQHLDVVLHHRPDQPTALMYLALQGERDRSPEGRARTRELVRLSLENAGGDPWHTVMAARIEAWLGGRAAARALVDNGLAEHPTDASLLRLKADLESTPADESLSIVSGLLASSPADPSLRARFDALVAARRRALTVMLWLAPALVAVAVGLASGGIRVGLLIGIAAASASVWQARRRAIAALPAGFRAELASRARWRRLTRVGGWSAAALTVVGGIAAAAGSPPGAWLLAASVAGWVVVRLAGFGQERRLAAAVDAEVAAARIPDATADADADASTDAAAGDADRATREIGPATRILAQGRWRRVFWTPVFLIPLCILGLVPAAAGDADSAARAAAGIIAAVVGLTSLVEAAPWTRERGAPGVTAWRVVLLALPGVLLTVVLLVSAANLVSATSAWLTGSEIEYSVPDDEPSGPATIPPGYFDDLESPQPMPTFTAPEFDLPSLPPLEPEG